MTHSNHRGVRHTGTEVALCIMTTVNELHVEKLAETEKCKRFLAGSKKKDAMHASLVEEVEKLESQANLLRVRFGRRAQISWMV